MDRLVLFNQKFFPSWRPRYLIYESRAALPRSAFRVLQAEGYLPRPGTRPEPGGEPWLRPSSCHPSRSGWADEKAGRRRPRSCSRPSASPCVGLFGAYGYGRDYYLHRGFAALVQLPRAGTGRLLAVNYYSTALHRRAGYMVYLPPGYSSIVATRSTTCSTGCPVSRRCSLISRTWTSGSTTSLRSATRGR